MKDAMIALLIVLQLLLLFMTWWWGWSIGHSMGYFEGMSKSCKNSTNEGQNF